MPRRILLVDDDRGIRETLLQILSLHGFEVTSAATVAEALKEIASVSFDVLISDLNIGHPGDGFTVVSAMRRTQPECVTLIVTGFPAFESALQAIRSQVDDYLVKPANVQELLGILEQQLNAPDRKAHNFTPSKRISAVIRENVEEIVRRALAASKARRDWAEAYLPSEARVSSFAPLLIGLAETLESAAPGQLSEQALGSAALRGKSSRSQMCPVPMLIANLRLLQQSLYEVIGENLLQLDLSHLIGDINRLNTALLLELEETVHSYLQAERRLSFESSQNWTGWFCERCCWNRPQPDSETARAALAATILAEFEAHRCNPFAHQTGASLPLPEECA
jgi:ActR/RegA family two-component response regulator